MLPNAPREGLDGWGGNHPAWPVYPATELFPLVAAELTELAEDIRKHGLGEAVWLYDALPVRVVVEQPAGEGDEFAGVR